MNLVSISTMIFLSVILVQAQQQPTQILTVVPFVDINRYVGNWYEIARLPNRFQKQCIGDVTATYILQSDGTIKVINRCQNANGEFEEAEGQAKKNRDDKSNAKLKVRFAPKILSFLPFVWGNYWVIDLAADYTYAVIGEPDRKYLWILSRTPTIDEDKLQIILEGIKAKGYDLSTLSRTKQTKSSE
ncbi:MAG: lipocalin [Chlorobiaceae bacterium]|nr:lipocalin [Chlorobiaceae bacterium]